MTRILEELEVDAFVEEADRLAQISHAQRLQHLSGHGLAYGNPPLAADARPDPFGPAWQAWVEADWRRASGRPAYALSMEADPNVRATQEQLSRLYPFVSQDTPFISGYMMGVYHVLGLLADAPNRRAVEYGVGWGHTSMALMQSGYDLLAVDIDSSWLELLKLRAERHAVRERLRTLHGQFGDLPSDLPPLGAAVFYECFHHALNHDDALARLVPSLADGGLVIFAGEPIQPGFPVDWGLRLDGHSVWAIRRFGWMELGFSEDYFVRLLRRHQLSVQRCNLDAAGAFGQVYKARKHLAGVPLGQTLLSSAERGFHPPEADPSVLTRFTDGDALLELPCGAPWVELELRNWMPLGVRCELRLEGEPVWNGVLEAGAVRQVRLPHSRTGYVRLLSILSETHVPAELGAGSDNRRLGIAVGRLCLHQT